jgi:hypothetical protein
VTIADLICCGPNRLPPMLAMFSSVALLLAFAASSLLVQVTAECTRFSTNGSTAATYDYYRFYDFRHLRGSIHGDAASGLSYGEGYMTTESSNGQSKIIKAAPWISGWNARDWFRPSPRENTVDMYYEPSRVSISKPSSLFRGLCSSLTRDR